MAKLLRPPRTRTNREAARKEKVEKIVEVLGDLVEATGLGGKVVVVEGVRDREALRRWGVQGKILCLKLRPDSLVEKMGRLSEREEEIVILTDFDIEGRRLARRMSEFLGRGRSLNLSYWRKLSVLASSDVKDVEGLVSYLKYRENPIKQLPSLRG